MNLFGIKIEQEVTILKLQSKNVQDILLQALLMKSIWYIKLKLLGKHGTWWTSAIMLPKININGSRAPAQAQATIYSFFLFEK